MNVLFKGPENYQEFKEFKEALLAADEQDNQPIELPEVISILLGDLNLILEFLYMVKILFFFIKFYN